MPRGHSMSIKMPIIVMLICFIHINKTVHQIFNIWRKMFTNIPFMILSAFFHIISPIKYRQLFQLYLVNRKDASLWHISRETTINNIGDCNWCGLFMGHFEKFFTTLTVFKKFLNFLTPTFIISWVINICDNAFSVPLNRYTVKWRKN